MTLRRLLSTLKDEAGTRRRLEVDEAYTHRLIGRSEGEGGGAVAVQLERRVSQVVREISSILISWPGVDVP